MLTGKSLDKIKEEADVDTRLNTLHTITRQFLQMSHIRAQAFLDLVSRA